MRNIYTIQSILILVPFDRECVCALYTYFIFAIFLYLSIFPSIFLSFAFDLIRLPTKPPTLQIALNESIDCSDTQNRSANTNIFNNIV